MALLKKLLQALWKANHEKVAWQVALACDVFEGYSATAMSNGVALRAGGTTPAKAVENLVKKLQAKKIIPDTL